MRARYSVKTAQEQGYQLLQKTSVQQVVSEKNLAKLSIQPAIGKQEGSCDVATEELVIRIKAGIDVGENMLELWKQTRGLIHAVAMHYRGYADLEDLEQEGYLALYNAVDGFEPDRGYRFATYAKHWIRQQMKRYVDNCCGLVRIPVHERDRLQRYGRMVSGFEAHYGRKPTREEAAYALNLGERQVQELEATLAMARVGSLDESLPGNEKGDTLGDLVPCGTDVEEGVTNRFDQEMLRAMIWPMVDRLSGSRPAVIRMKYQEGRSRKEIGEACGETEDAVRKIERKALGQLRKSNGIQRLQAFLPELEEAQAYRHVGVQQFNRIWESSTERVAIRLLEKGK